MDKAYDLLLKRRSVRSFSQDQVDTELIERIINAGLHAATAMNRQSWHFTVVQDRSFLTAISKAVGAVLIDSGVPSLIERAKSEDFSTFHHAPTVIFVSSDGSHYSLADCANASQNMCLAAASLGLGSCYIGSFVQAFDHPSGKQLLERFDVPQGYRPVFAIAIGKPTDESLILGEKEIERKVSYIL
ncbi:nitroreductase family protein [Pleomorphochaeta sp. DL1XJH-081]|uniref:nitroreductase family protein n=1 Tax=Pleomorphochaeta sp. DL1XJH-081 TaxID=3409690 RepID=UPI003BB7A1FD